jgi:heat shock protein HslJ
VLIAASFALVGCDDDATTGDRASTTSIGDETSTTVPADEPADTRTTDDPRLPTGLVGPTWVLDGVITIAGPQAPPAGVRANVTISADGTVAVDAGCSTAETTITAADGSHLTLSPLALTDMSCSDEQVNTFDTAVGMILAAESTWTVNGDTLSVIPLMISDSGLTFHR